MSVFLRVFRTLPWQDEDLISGTSAEDVRELRSAFYTAAKSGDGSIDGPELKAMLESLGYAPTSSQTDSIIMQVGRGYKVSCRPWRDPWK